MLLAPVFWTALEWVRLGVTGQLWNALGYSQAYHPLLIQPATWGGVYAVSFLIVAINAVVALLISRQDAMDHRRGAADPYWCCLCDRESRSPGDRLIARSSMNVHR